MDTKDKQDSADSKSWIARFLKLVPLAILIWIAVVMFANSPLAPRPSDVPDQIDPARPIPVERPETDGNEDARIGNANIRYQRLLRKELELVYVLNDHAKLRHDIAWMENAGDFEPSRGRLTRDESRAAKAVWQELRLKPARYDSGVVKQVASEFLALATAKSRTEAQRTRLDELIDASREPIEFFAPGSVWEDWSRLKELYARLTGEPWPEAQTYPKTR